MPDPRTDQEVAIEFPVDDEGRVWLCQCGVWGTGRERCWTCGSESLRPAVMQARGASVPSTDPAICGYRHTYSLTQEVVVCERELDHPGCHESTATECRWWGPEVEQSLTVPKYHEVGLLDEDAEAYAIGVREAFRLSPAPSIEGLQGALRGILDQRDTEWATDPGDMDQRFVANHYAAAKLSRIFALAEAALSTVPPARRSQ